MLQVPVPKFTGRWVAIPGRVNQGKLSISVIPAVAIEAKDCLTLRELDVKIPGLLAMVEYWPEISRAMTWTVTTSTGGLNVAPHSYFDPKYADDWRRIAWSTLTFRCPNPIEAEAHNIVHTRTAALAKWLSGPEGVLFETRKATIEGWRAASTSPDPARFSERVEAEPLLGGFDLAQLAMRPSPYEPLAEAARRRKMLDEGGPRELDGLNDRVGAAMLDALDPVGHGRNLTLGTLDVINRNFFAGTAWNSASDEPQCDVDALHQYFCRTALECAPWPQRTQELRDFQEFWNGFLGYPALARVFGITIDLDAEVAGASWLHDGATFWIRVKGHLADDALPEQVPREARELVNGSFLTPRTESYAVVLNLPGAQRTIVLPRSSADEKLSGVLALNGCQLVSINVDDAAHKLRSTGESERCKEDSTVLGPLPDRNLPSLSTWGLALMHPSEDRLKIARPTKTSGEEQLFAEHLTAGHRFDVRDIRSDRGWTSLCARKVSYESTAPSPRPITCEASGGDADSALSAFEEGIVRNVSRKVKLKDQNGHLVADELFLWQDWPVTVPAESDEQTVFRFDDGREMPYKPSVTYLADHDERLRFGHTYGAAARIAYLNGGGLSTVEALALRQKLAQQGTTAVLEVSDVFDRQEPLRPPEVHVAASIDDRQTPGDQIDVVIVRSGPDIDEHQGRSARYVVPPRVSAELANLDSHAFDRVDDKPEPPDGSLAHVYLTCSGDVPTVQELRTKFGDKYVHEPPTPTHQNDTMVVFDNSRKGEVQHEYYVDPCVRYIHAGLVPSSVSCWADRLPPLEAVETDEWPKAKLFRLELEADTNLPEHCVAGWKRTFAGLFDPCRDVLGIRLAPAEELVLKLWSGTDRPRSECLNAYRMSRDILSRIGSSGASETEFTDLLKVSLPFANPMREVTLVHAVQKPLVVPSFDASANVGRQRLGDPGVAFEGYALCHRPSTGALECFASWREFIDDTTFPAPRWIEKREASPVIPSMILKRGAWYRDRAAFDVDDDGTKLAPRHQMGSTHRRSVSYWLEGVSAFARFFPKTLATKCRTTYDDAVREDKVLSVEIPASDPPDPPIVSVVVPLFSQSENHDDGVDEVSRTCIGFRVKLARPFFTRGQSQQLAVMCWPSGTFSTGAKYRTRFNTIGSQLQPGSAIPKPLEPYVSRIGQDPMWPGAAPFDVLPPDFFVGGKEGKEEIEFPGVQEEAAEDPNGTVVVKKIAGTVSFVSFDVRPESLDPALQEYCCDIGINPAAIARRPADQPYFPFVRLAFAAYQPVAIPGALLSPVVVADLIQLHPNRQAQVIYQPRWHRARLRVTGFGQPEFNAAKAVESSLEQHTPAFEVRAQLFWRAHPDAPPQQHSPLITLPIESGDDGYHAIWQFTRPSAPKNGVFELLVEEVWLVRCEDADMDPDGCTAWLSPQTKAAFVVKEYPRVLLRLPLMNC